ncbi:MAG TPA: undecaprenyl-diphosphatase UppP [Armatimonadetes bacterium]|nr:undecaprenyl-diphosphatase UppP [Armatimonadota bacterium]
MSVIHALLTGAIQGITEFIPISSSAHLVILPWLLRWKTLSPPHSIVFDVALHLGTLFALLVYFWRDWYEIISDFIRHNILHSKSEGKGYLFVPLLIACIPAAVAGLLMESSIDSLFRTRPLLIACSVIVMGLVLLIADRAGNKSRPMEKVTARDCLIIGFAQALALVPGVSRSGITITAGLFCGLKRDTAARFSFLVGGPIILGAAIFEMRHLSSMPSDAIIPMIVGVLASAVTGYICISFLISYLKTRSADLFVGYRIVFGLATILFWYKGFFS